MQHSTSLPLVPTGNKLLANTSAGDAMLHERRRAFDKKQAAEKRGSISQIDTKYRGMSELLRPKDNDPRAGSWTRWSVHKDAKFFAALDADIAFAEECIRLGTNPKKAWQMGAARALGKDKLSFLMGKGDKNWKGVTSDESLEELRDELERQKEAQAMVIFDEVLDEVLDEESELLARDALTDEQMRRRLLAEQAARDAAKRAAAERAAELLRETAEREAREEEERDAAARKSAQRFAKRAAQSAIEAQSDAVSAEEASASVQDPKDVKKLAVKARNAAGSADEGAARAAGAADAQPADVAAASGAADDAAKAAAEAKAAAAAALAAADKHLSASPTGKPQQRRENRVGARPVARRQQAKGTPGAVASRAPELKVPGITSSLAVVSTPAATGDPEDDDSAVEEAAWEEEEEEDMMPEEREHPSVELPSLEQTIIPTRVVRPVFDYESADALRAFDMFGGGISNFLARARKPPTKWVDDRGCIRFLQDTMDGGPSHLLPVVDIDDLREVLVHAGMRPDRWGHQQLSSLFAELATREATLFSLSMNEPLRSELPLPVLGERGSLDMCPYLLMKRKVVIVHVLNASGSCELVQASSSAEGAAAYPEGGEDNGLFIGSAQRAEDLSGAVQYRRLSGRLSDGTPPLRLAINLIRSALGVPESSVRQLDSYPSITRSDPTKRCAFPGLGCEQMFYIVRVWCDKLPPHAFRAKRVEWEWVLPNARRKPELSVWTQRPEPMAPKEKELNEIVRRSPQPLTGLVRSASMSSASPRRLERGLLASPSRERSSDLPPVRVSWAGPAALR